MNNCFVPFKNSETFGVVSITLANLISSRFYFFFYPARKPFYFIIEFVMMKYIESHVWIALSLAGIKRMHIKYIPSFKIFKQEFSIRSEEHTSELQSRFALVCLCVPSFPPRRSSDLTLANLISSRFYFFFYPARKPFYFIIEFVMMKYIESHVWIALSLAGIKRMHIKYIPSFKIFKQEFSI